MGKEIGLKFWWIMLIANEIRIGDDPLREEPVEIRRVHPIDDRDELDGPSSRNPGHEVDDSEVRERIRGLGDDRRRRHLDGHASRCGSKLIEVGHAARG